MPKIDLDSLPTRSASSYPPPHDAPIAGKRIGVEVARASGLNAFGAWRITLLPGAWSSQRHWHSHEDELLVMLAGEAVLVENDGETLLRPGDIATFPAGRPNGHHLINRSEAPARFLVMGPDFEAEDICHYPDIGMRWTPGIGYHFPE